MLVAHAVRRQSLFIVGLAICISACTSPSSPGIQTFTLSGLILDPSGTPVADAMIQVTSGSLTGRVTASDTSGRFQFADTISVSEPTTLQVLKEGYFPVTVQVERTNVVVTLSVSRLPIEGDYTITFAAADECSMLPVTLRRRAYFSRIAIWGRSLSDTTFAIELSGSTFFAELRTLSLSIRGNTAKFFIASFEAQQRWLDELPIYERLGATEYVSLYGTATAAMGVTDTAFTTTFDGIMSYCPNSTDPLAPGYPPKCATAAVECHSSHHQLTGSQR